MQALFQSLKSLSQQDVQAQRSQSLKTESYQLFVASSFPVGIDDSG